MRQGLRETQGGERLRLTKVASTNRAANEGLRQVRTGEGFEAGAGLEEGLRQAKIASRSRMENRGLRQEEGEGGVESGEDGVQEQGGGGVEAGGLRGRKRSLARLCACYVVQHLAVPTSN